MKKHIIFSQFILLTFFLSTYAQDLPPLISFKFNQTPLKNALGALIDQYKIPIAYRDEQVEDITVSAVCENSSVEKAMNLLLNNSSLTWQSVGQQVVILPSAHQGSRAGKMSNTEKGSIIGRVIDEETKQPLIGTNILIVGTQQGGTTDLNGKFSLNKLSAGSYTLRFNYIGYETKQVTNIPIEPGNVKQIQVELKPKALELKEITVTPSQFSIMGSEPTVKQSLTKEDIQTITWGEDIYRAITRLPGISCNDYSARFTVRGGEYNQILVMMDGLELYEPFHLKDVYGGAISIIDVEAIEKIDLLTGGFTAEYGNRMSGVFNIKSTRPAAEKQRTSMGISLMNARLMSEGTFSENRGSWLISARRGYLDLVLDLMKEQNNPSPIYYDILSKVEYKLDGTHTLSANFLHSGDQVSFTELDNDIDESSYYNSYGWLTLKSIPSARMFIQTVASYGKLAHHRKAIGYLDDGHVINLTLADKRNFNVYGLKQDWNFEPNDRWFLKWGFDLKGYTADYDYVSTKLNSYLISSDKKIVRTDSNQVDIKPAGRRIGIYFSNRFRLLSPLTAELGLRYDYTSYTKDKLISPRINLVYRLGKQTFLRSGWGYFYQSAGIHEIRVEDGEDHFYPAELAEHWAVGLEHVFHNGIVVRLEGYYKTLSHLRPDYRNWTNSSEFYPELLDRFKLNLNSVESKGIEVYARYDRGGKITWWASYALASVRDNIRSLFYQGIEYPERSGYYPGRYNQRHTIYFDLNYRPNRNWHFNLAWQYHTGWPYTDQMMKTRTLPDGSTQYDLTYGEFNGANYPAYHRLDLRINRHFYISRGRISAFLALINIYNRGNVMDFYWATNPNGQPYPVKEKEYWFRLLPSVGVSWRWEH
jgi:outer membrane cobalamin receptor